MSLDDESYFSALNNRKPRNNSATHPVQRLVRSMYNNSFVQQTCISQSLPKGPVDVLAAFGHLLLLIPNALQTLMHGKAFRQRTNLVERDVKHTKTRLWV